MAAAKFAACAAGGEFSASRVRCAQREGAGATGLNLQHASTLVNMDTPWNPALLEQRIGRIHRMGQKRPVRIVNFVAKGTIEEGMLSVLAFKRSLSAGILDGGTGEISLGGSRLNRFMKDVENVTSHMGEGVSMAPAEEVGNLAAATPVSSIQDENMDATVDSSVEHTPTPHDAGNATETSPCPDVDPWHALMQVGVQMVSALAAANDPAAPTHPWIDRDPTTGARNLKIPLPPPETARRLADMLAVLADSLRGRDGR